MLGEKVMCAAVSPLLCVILPCIQVQCYPPVWHLHFDLEDFSQLLILPFSVFPLYAHTRLVQGHFLVLHQQSGTLSLTKSGHPTPSHPSNHHLKRIFSSSPTDCVCVWEGGGSERETELVVYRKV